MTALSDLGRYALRYAEIGLHVFPCRPESKIPDTARGWHDATTDPSAITEWWAAVPTRGIGLALYPSGLIAIDVDLHGGVDGWATLSGLESRLGPLPQLCRARTPSGGGHILAADPGVPLSGTLGPGIDVLGKKYIVIEPSTHPDGGKYAWEFSPFEYPERLLVALPPAWLDAMRRPARAPRTPAAPSCTTVGSSYGLAGLEGEISGLRGAIEGQRNERLNIAAFSVGQLIAGGQLDSGTARAALLDAAREIGLSDIESRRTVDSGCRAGSAIPRRGAAGGPSPSVGDYPPSAIEVIDDEWRGSLTLTKERVDKTPSNLMITLQNLPTWAGSVRRDELLVRDVWTRVIPGTGIRPGPLCDDDYIEVQGAIKASEGVLYSVDSVQRAVSGAARAASYHPVLDYLSSLSWDGQERVATWLQDYLGAEGGGPPTGLWWLVSAVARVCDPGCQADHMLVLEGGQGVGKSTAASILGGPWYSGELGDLESKDAAQSLAGAWLVEIAELDAFRRSQVTRIKTFLSTRCDHYRPSYGRNVVDRKRQCVFIGTTNEFKYLQDASGGRRFWPVRVCGCDVAALERDRDQLWAEAYHLYRQGQRWWPVAGESRELAESADERYATDPWEDDVERWIRDRMEPPTMREILAGACRMDVDRMDRSSATRVGIILTRLGYRSKQVRRNGVQVRIYVVAHCDAL